MIDNEIRERLLKLASLAERGIGGERENAQRSLDATLKKHGLTREDLTRTERSPVRLRLPKGTWGRKLFIQAACEVLQTYEIRVHFERGWAYAKLSPSEKLSIQLLLDIYGPALNVHMRASFSAFVIKNSLLGKAHPEEEKRSADEEMSKAVINLLPGTQAIPRPNRRLTKKT